MATGSVPALEEPQEGRGSVVTVSQEKERLLKLAFALPLKEAMEATKPDKKKIKAAAQEMSKLRQRALKRLQEIIATFQQSPEFGEEDVAKVEAIVGGATLVDLRSLVKAPPGADKKTVLAVFMCGVRRAQSVFRGPSRLADIEGLRAPTERYMERMRRSVTSHGLDLMVVEARPACAASLESEAERRAFLGSPVCTSQYWRSLERLLLRLYVCVMQKRRHLVAVVTFGGVATQAALGFGPESNANVALQVAMVPKGQLAFCGPHSFGHSTTFDVHMDVHPARVSRAMEGLGTSDRRELAALAENRERVLLDNLALYGDNKEGTPKMHHPRADAKRMRNLLLRAGAGAEGNEELSLTLRAYEFMCRHEDCFPVALCHEKTRSASEKKTRSASEKKTRSASEKKTRSVTGKPSSAFETKVKEAWDATRLCMPLMMQRAAALAKARGQLATANGKGKSAWLVQWPRTARKEEQVAPFACCAADLQVLDEKTALVQEVYGSSGVRSVSSAWDATGTVIRSIEEQGRGRISCSLSQELLQREPTPAIKNSLRDCAEEGKVVLLRQHAPDGRSVELRLGFFPPTTDRIRIKGITIHNIYPPLNEPGVPGHRAYLLAPEAVSLRKEESQQAIRRGLHARCSTLSPRGYPFTSWQVATAAGTEAKGTVVAVQDLATVYGGQVLQMDSDSSCVYVSRDGSVTSRKRRKKNDEPPGWEKLLLQVVQEGEEEEGEEGEEVEEKCLRVVGEPLRAPNVSLSERKKEMEESEWKGESR
jgi:hypothetical protein